MPDSDPFDLQRFVTAQAGVIESALRELGQGRKQSHWMWFVFPQLDGLGFSPTTRFYSIKSKEEARAYLAHPLLGSRLTECTQMVLSVQGRSAHEIFGSPDDLKFHSSLTLFADVSASGSVFEHALDKYFAGQRDSRTLALLEKLKG